MSLEDQDFMRTKELVNKTNQFNTTGVRWNSEEFSLLFQSGGYVVVAHVSDKFTNYGLVCCMIVNKLILEQFVMSCRVIGLDIEVAAINYLLNLKQNYAKAVRAKLIMTEYNKPCQQVYKNVGFEYNEELDVWQLPEHHECIPPKHISFT